ncbi:apotyrosinase chaperone MelC1 [Streptomyces sp. CA-135486]|uniref:apotyrosinase chaperone MelC1 n=1 Tax=Streptomyces sp. CA-135486 TaxID=3240049 RepID=UPI003D8BB377
MPEITRRRALGAVAGAAAALGVAGTAAAAARSASTADPASFDEVYQGRRIQGAPSPGGGHDEHGGGHGGHGGHGGGYTVRIDGEELHVMRNADGTWISVVNHYETFATPRAVARAAVRELQGAQLVPLAVV